MKGKGHPNSMPMKAQRECRGGAPINPQPRR